MLKINCFDIFRNALLFLAIGCLPLAVTSYKILKSHQALPYCRPVLSRTYYAREVGPHRLGRSQIRGPVRPVSHHVLVVPKSGDIISESGLALIENPRLLIGRAIASNEHYTDVYSGSQVPTDICSGDWVLFDREYGEPVNYDDQECIVLRHSTILGTLKTDKVIPEHVAPLLDSLLLKVSRADNKTPFGLFLHNAEKQHVYDGTVISVGKGGIDVHGSRVPIPVKIGQRVRIERLAYRGGGHLYDREIRYKGEPYVFVRAGELLGIWNES